MPQARKKPDAPARPARQTKTPQEPKRQDSATPPRPAKSKQPTRSKGLEERDLVRLANYFFSYHEWMIYLAQSVDRPSPLRLRFDEHLGANASELPILSETFESYDQVNVQRAIDRYLAAKGRTHDLVGVAEGRKMTLADLIAWKQRGASRPDRLSM